MEQTRVSIILQDNHVENSSLPKVKTNDITSENRMHNSTKTIKLSWLKRLMKEDVSISEIAKMSLAELIGTAMLVFMGCMGCVGTLGSSPSSLQISLTFGLTVMVVIQGLGHVSGAHINPAITIGAIVLGKKSLPIAIIYIVAQIIGGVLGYGLLKIVTPEILLHNGDASSASSFCVTDIHNQVSVIQGFLIEIIATGILMLVTCGVWDSRNANYGDSVAIKFGLTVTVLCIAVAPYTGCSMNPARSFGPALWNNNWSNHWIFWFGPFAGSLIASILYRSIFSPKEIEPELMEPALTNVEIPRTG